MLFGVLPSHVTYEMNFFIFICVDIDVYVFILRSRFQSHCTWLQFAVSPWLTPITNDDTIYMLNVT